MADLVDSPVCSECFTDEGLRLDAQHLGVPSREPCPNCAATNGYRLTHDLVETLAHRFFVRGSLVRYEYGAAPQIQFNVEQTTSIVVAGWLEADMRLLERTLGVGFFGYGPRFWMFGEVEPLKALQNTSSREAVLSRILAEYPAMALDSNQSFYRIRRAPANPDAPGEYDSPPASLSGRGRLDSSDLPVMYGSPDLQVCIHECRATMEDELFVATLAPTVTLRLLDVSALLVEDVTEFESLDIAMHMLFLAGGHSYEITRQLARAAHAAGFDGLVFPSYFSLVRTGSMPFETIYGISRRRMSQLHAFERSKIVPNLAIFGRPLEAGKVAVRCINRLILQRVEYSVHFGPVGVTLI